MTDALIVARVLARAGLATAALAASLGYIMAWEAVARVAAQVGAGALLLVQLLFLSGALLLASEGLKAMGRRT